MIDKHLESAYYGVKYFVSVLFWHVIVEKSRSVAININSDCIQPVGTLPFSIVASAIKTKVVTHVLCFCCDKSKYQQWITNTVMDFKENNCNLNPSRNTGHKKHNYVFTTYSLAWIMFTALVNY